MPILPSTVTRAAVVREARAWIGTPYHHGALVKGPQGGVDCAMLMAGVYGNVGYLPPFDVGHYPPDWFLHRRAERYLNMVTDHAEEIPESAALPGDLVLFMVGHLYAHGAIVDEPGWPNIIHAHSDAGMVIPDIGGTGRMANAKRRFFTIWPPEPIAEDGITATDKPEPAA